MKITSIKNPIIEQARKLQSATGRKQIGKVLLYGLEQIEWALKANLFIEHIFIEQNNTKLYDAIENKNIIIEVSTGILKKISDTNYVIPCIAVAQIKENQLETKDFVIVLDNVKDFGNIGSIIRTAQGFFVDQFLLTNMETDLFQRKIIDASRGLIFNSTIQEINSVKESIEYLKQNNYQIIATSPHATNLQSQTPLSSKKIALIIGNETSGVCDQFLKAADITIQIPMSQHVESLNVSVFAGISIYELKFRQVLMMSAFNNQVQQRD